MLKTERISQMTHRIFNTTLTEKRVARSSNPFTPSNLLSVDILELSNKKSAKANDNLNITASVKRIYSTYVGSINDFGKNFYEGIKEFGLRMKDGIVNTWNKVQEFGNKEVNIVEGIKNGFGGIKNVLSTDMSYLLDSRTKAINKMAKMDPHTEIKPMLADSIKALEEDIALVA